MPVEFSGELFYENDVTASYYCSFITANQQWAHVCGTDGTLRVDDFVVPFFGSEAKYTVNTESNQRVCDFNMEQRDRVVSVKETPSPIPQRRSQSLSKLRRPCPQR